MCVSVDGNEGINQTCSVAKRNSATGLGQLAVKYSKKMS